MPKNIIHLIATNFYGGPEKQIIEHLSRLRNDFSGTLISFIDKGRPNESLQWAKRKGVKCFGIPMKGPLDLKAWKMLLEFIRQGQFDLLCAHGYRSTVMGWLVGRRVKIPVLSFSRGYTTENIKVALYEWLERKVLGKVAGIIFVSQGQKRRLESYGVWNKHNWVVHNAVLTEEIEEGPRRSKLKDKICRDFEIPNKANLVVSAGRLSPEKGHRFFIEAISKLKSNNSYFLFCGEGPCRKDLEKMSYNYGIYDHCRFLGFMKQIQDIFQVMDLMVLPSLTEGLPNVVLEAFSLAKPVVATAVGGVPEVIDDGVNGVLVPPAQPTRLSMAIDKCLSDPDLRLKLGKAGYEKVKSQFTFESQRIKLEAIYQQVLKEGYEGNEEIKKSSCSQ